MKAIEALKRYEEANKPFKEWQDILKERGKKVFKEVKKHYEEQK